MRSIRTFTAGIAILMCAKAAYAQDLQYKAVTRTVMPGAAMEMPSPVSTTYVKGSLLRSDTDLESPFASMHMSMIIDGSKNTMTVLQHNEKKYFQQALDLPAQAQEAMNNIVRDSIKITKTPETAMLGGYQTHRVISTTPVSGKMTSMFRLNKGYHMVMLVDAWVTDDSILSSTMKKFGESMRDLAGGTVSISTNKTDVGGFPMLMTTYMVQVPDNQPLDGAALARLGDQMPYLVMKTEVEVQDIKFTTIDPALFIVPANYKKTDKKF